MAYVMGVGSVHRLNEMDMNFPHTVSFRAEPTNLPFLCDKKIRITTDQPPGQQRRATALTTTGRSVGWAIRAMNTTEICQTRQPWCCDQQSFLTAPVILAVQRHPETKSTWALRFVCALTRSLAPCRRSLAPLLAIYPTRDRGNVACFVWPSCRSRSAGVLLRSHQPRVPPSVRAPNPPLFTTHEHISSPPPPASAQGWKRAEFPIQVSFVFLPGRDY